MKSDVSGSLYTRDVDTGEWLTFGGDVTRPTPRLLDTIALGKPPPGSHGGTSGSHAECNAGNLACNTLGIWGSHDRFSHARLSGCNFSLNLKLIPSVIKNRQISIDDWIVKIMRSRYCDHSSYTINAITLTIFVRIS